ncbi:prenyltransferase [Undibacterium sp. CY21W]|uniref:prenyltransferase n=1 Tax=Undibacterium sp. CY21W TaxID=2762293 RepID=UPI00164B5BA6|nr:prenyltransferase [Undibacterium sp. CY21W]MBC3929787.1 prenyltransferase [Undibacterium sp. CY21W]
MPAVEPNLNNMANPVLRYLMATRPAFLTVTLFAGFIGLASAYADGVPIDLLTAGMSLLFGLVAHAGINVLNDYYDALNGTDDANNERIFPFTGGSRFIQNGVLSRRETAIFGGILMLLVVVAGIWLMLVSDAALLWIGAAGLFIGWAYSAPPFKLNSRGLGEIGVWAGFALIAIGSDVVQRGTFSVKPLIAVASYALLVTDLLFINQFPDEKADGIAGKRHWVVRLGHHNARWLYAVIAAAAYLWLAAAVWGGALPRFALLALASSVLSLQAARTLIQHSATPSSLTPAIQQTIAAAALHGLLLSIGIAAAVVF